MKTLKEIILPQHKGPGFVASLEMTGAQVGIKKRYRNGADVHITKSAARENLYADPASLAAWLNAGMEATVEEPAVKAAKPKASTGKKTPVTAATK